MSILHHVSHVENVFPAKHLKSLSMLLFSFMAFFLTTGIMAQNRYVSVSGTDSGNCSLPGSPCLTIQYAVNQAVAGDNINVSAGMYNENVSINLSLQLLGTNATVVGAPVALGTFLIPNGVNNVTIDGFTLVGYDSPLPGIEYAALYIQGNHSNIIITNNTITADGEAALLEEFGGICTNLVIDNNTFNGKTFVGANPGDCGFANQFTASNVPRQLVVIGNSDSNVQFTNNTINGVAGGTGTVPPCDVTGQGNTMVTIDATNVTITGNSFGGVTTRFASLLRTRGTQNNISGNIFDGTGLQGSATFHFLGANALTGGMPSNVNDMFNANSYAPAAILIPGTGGSFTIFSCSGPILSTSINNVASTHTSNDGVTDTLTLEMCDIEDNITFDLFQDLFTPPLSNVKVYQWVELDNTSASFCNNCSMGLSQFTNTIGTVSLSDNTVPGTITMKFLAYADANDNNIIDPNECISDTVIYIMDVNPNPVADITPDPAEACILTNIQMNGNPTGGTLPYMHIWTGDGASFLSDTDIVNPVFNHHQLGAYGVSYIVTDDKGCTSSDQLTINLTDNDEPVVNCPVSPFIMNTDPDRCDAIVCYPVTTSDDCPFYYPPTLDDHVYIGTFGGSTYYRSVNAMSWDAANNAAATLGGHLVNITSAGEQNYLSSEIPDGPFSIFWIGLRYSTASASYKWTSGATVTYTNWASGEPSLSGVNDFVYLDETNTSGTGWYNTGDDEDQRYIIEFSGLPKKLISGLPSGSVFPLGDTEITYETEDSAGNTSECTFTVTVIDEQDPVLTCPDDVTINLEPLECEGLAFYEATAKDNCSVASIDYSIPSGSFFPIGINPVTVTATDASGNTDECTFNVWVFDYINPNLACKPVNLSLDEFCSTTLDPTIFLTGWQGPNPDDILIGCPDKFIITFMNDKGDIIPVDQLKHNIGKTLHVRISHTMQSFQCWNTALIEDKLPPQIDCRDIEVNCLADTKNLVVAFASDNCQALPHLVNETHQVICDPNFIGTITRRYIAIDKFGNQSPDTCTAVIYLERSNFGGIVPPQNDTLECSDNFRKDTKGYNNPHPNVTGVPTFNGVPVYPTSALQMLFCNATIDYEDLILYDTPCKKRLIRTWKIYEWHCTGLVTHVIGLPQIIDILDKTPPVIPVVNNQLLTTRTKSCSATAQLPQLNITDNCNQIKSVTINVFNDGSPVGTLPTNGGVLELPVGDNAVEYRAIDACNNVSTRRFTITVQDDTNPIALCDQFTTVSIKTNGYTEVTAVAVDDGSFDECGDVTLQLQRMEDPCGTDYHIGWHDKVGFCCEDANTSRMVTLLVTDEGGNTNMCMVTVNVQEKVNPSITCPADITIEDCTYTFDPNNLDFYFGEATIFDNCPANNEIIQEYDDFRNDCGTGTLVRYFEVQYNGISYGTCTQTITFENNDPFDGDDILDLAWPADYMAVNTCDMLELEPENLPPGFNFPVISEDACDRVGFTKDDQIFPFTTNDACIKIIRTWTVIDWCQTDIDGNYLVWTRDQEIKITDNTIPVITSPDTTRITYSFDANCMSGVIEINATATDCTPEEELEWNYIIYDAVGDVYATGSGNDASGNYPVGDYQVEFTVEDRCGNLATTGYTFEVISVKPATPICFKGLSSDLMTMDLDMDGTPDTAMVTIHVDMFNNGSYHDCYPNDPLQFSFSSDVNDTVRVFGCSDLGLRPITMYVTDINGNQSFCTTDILITNNDSTNYNCPNGTGGLLSGDIRGRITNEKEIAIINVAVTLTGTEIGARMTNETGGYVFDKLPLGGHYSVNPEKDGDDKNGVSTLDMVLIQRHILGIEKLPSLYKYVAADVNHDDKINTVDLVELRKLILGTITSFQANTSWRFVERDFQFLDPSNPLALFIPGMCAIVNMQQSMEADFIGVKIGDVNETASTNLTEPEAIESRHYFAFMADDKAVKAGEEVKVVVRSNSNTTLYGWQQQLQLENATLTSVESASIPEIAESIVHTNDAIGFSVAIGEGKVVNAGENLFTLTFTANKDGKVSDFIQMTDETLRPEVYADGVAVAKSLRWVWTEVADEVFDIVKHQPNPWKESTMIGFTIPRADMVTVKVKDQTGRTVYSNTEYFQAGEQNVTITREAIQTSGLYFVEIKYNREVKTIKTIMID